MGRGSGLVGGIVRDVAGNVISKKINKHLPFKKGGGVSGHRARIPGKKLGVIRSGLYKKGGRVKRSGKRVRH